MDVGVFEAFRAFIHAQTGVSMHKGKEALLRARISERMRALSIDDPGRYLALVEGDRSGVELRTFINSITTNTTSFFRAPQHFSLLAEHARRWQELGAPRYRVWSAASSTGEEPWSIAITLVRSIPGCAQRDVRVLATDIDTDVLAEAKTAQYGERALETVPAALRERAFVPARRANGQACQAISPELRTLVQFARLNLIRPPYPMRGPFDVIFCRNVLIYFDQDTRLRVLSAMADLLDPNGLLILGPSESALGLDHLLRRATDSVYVRRSP